MLRTAPFLFLILLTMTGCMPMSSDRLHGDHGNTDLPAAFLPGQGLSTADLPEVRPTEMLAVSDGQTITLRAGFVRANLFGQERIFYGYNGQIPGPTIVAPQGATFAVRFENALDMPSTIHWHGVRLQNASDGVPGVTQDAVEPGGTFTYHVTVPDDGMYWYHPHVREDIQQDMGLYGVLLVRPERPDAWPPVDDERVAVLDDLLVRSNGNLVPYGGKQANFAMMGRFGNRFLVNGASDASWTVARGSVVRFHLLNAANTRTFRIAFPSVSGGAPARMKLVGGDNGRYAEERWVESVDLAPSERAMVDVTFPGEGPYALRHMNPLAAADLATILVGNAAPTVQESAPRTHDDVAASMAPLAAAFHAPPDKILRLEMTTRHGMMGHTMMDMGDQGDGIEWEDTMPGMNAMMDASALDWQLVDEVTGKANMDIDWTFPRGSVVKIRIRNDVKTGHPMQHPIHLHGQRFLVVQRNGEPVTGHVWKDTIQVKTGETVDIVAVMENPGDWMIHCHIAEHLTDGMMAVFRVLPE